MADTNSDTPGIITDKELELIRQAIASIRYGTVNLIIQDGKLIQIDKLEKYRLK